MQSLWAGFFAVSFSRMGHGDTGSEEPNQQHVGVESGKAYNCSWGAEAAMDIGMSGTTLCCRDDHFCGGI